MTEMSKPPKAEVVETAPDAPERPMVGTQHQYLDGFLSGDTQEAALPEGETLDDKLLAALRSIYDPEIPVNIFDLGLIYDCEIDEDNKVFVTMTLTTPHCPVAETMPGEVEMRLAAVEGVMEVEVKLVWDPPWTPERMSDEAKLELGFL